MIEEIISSINLIVMQTQHNIYMLAIILFIPWLFFLVSTINKRVLLLGIIPRHARGLAGIIFAPVLHANFNHLFFNSIPLIVLSNFILINGLNYYMTVTVLITLISGMCIWGLAKSGLHIGASALITGYWGFLISNIYQNTSFTTLILGILSLYYFAGIFLGIFPREKGVSWQGHLFGLIAGFVTSYIIATGKVHL